MAGPSRFELPTDRLATTDELGRRVYLYPADVGGRYRARRTGLSAVLIVIFLVLPWVRIRGRPALLLDIAHGKFAIAGIGFWAHEAPLLFLVAATAILLLALVTAVWGRVWCGWACPQTVFVDSVFRRIERGIEGDTLARRKLDESPWSREKLGKKSLKWALFAAVSLVLSHSFIAYFVGTEALAAMIASSPLESPYAFSAMLLMFSAVLFDFGWFREQFCVVVCPYGRFQSVLMDERSQVVLYDQRRGEPRRGAALDGKPPGDCVNCYRCVQVCPTGIDIRRGTQLECVACTACIDACDEVMRRIHKPEGLIRYASAAGMAGPASGGNAAPSRGRLNLSPRVIAYALLLGGLTAALTTVLLLRRPLALTLLRAQETPYQVSGDGEITNHYKLDLRNQSFEPVAVSFELDNAPVGMSFVVSNHAPELGAGAPERADLFIVFPRSALARGKGRASLHVTVKNGAGKPIDERFEEVALVGPYL